MVCQHQNRLRVYPRVESSKRVTNNLQVLQVLFGKLKKMSAVVQGCWFCKEETRGTGMGTVTAEFLSIDHGIFTNHPGKKTQSYQGDHSCQTRSSIFKSLSNLVYPDIVLSDQWPLPKNINNQHPLASKFDA